MVPDDSNSEEILELTDIIQKGDLAEGGADSGDGRDGPTEYVIAAGELMGVLHDDDVLSPLDDAHDRGVPSGVETDCALRTGGNVEAAGAQADLAAHIEDGGGQAFGVGLVGIENVKGQALGTLSADAGKTGELVDEPLDRRFKHH